MPSVKNITVKLIIRISSKKSNILKATTKKMTVGLKGRVCIWGIRLQLGAAQL